MNASLESFFNSVVSETQIATFVGEGREEDLYLEFKEKHDRRTGNIDESDRKNFSKGLSAFANADGGVLLWGVETKKSPDNPDRASKLKPLHKAEEFRAKLLDSILNVTQPSVDGVRIEVVRGGTEGDFVKCLVPSSDRPPHRAMSAEREYWRRLSTGCRRMEHYELEDVFGRRMRPVLRLSAELRTSPDPDPHGEVHFGLLNEGRGLARHAGFLCRLGDGGVVTIVACPGLGDASLLNQAPIVSYYDAHIVVHPNGLYTSVGRAIIRRPNKGAPLPIEVTWYAENMETRSERIELQPQERKLLKG